VDYFNRRNLRCPYEPCGRQFSWWRAFLGGFEMMGDTGNVALSTLAVMTLVDLQIEAGNVATLRLADYGVPAHADVVDVSVFPATTDNGLLLDPMEWHGLPRIRLTLPHSFDFYTVGWAGVAPGTRAVTCSSTKWIDTRLAPDALRNLTQAVTAFGVKEYDRVVVPANVAMELTLTRLLLDRGPPTGVSKTKIRRATYECRLRHLLPELADALGRPPLPNTVESALHDLRQQRNAVGHTGRTRRRLTRAQAARFLAAAIFGIEYTELDWAPSIPPRRAPQQPDGLARADRGSPP
jgi:hypothetical protein